MNLSQFNACVDGYSMRLLDQQKIAVQQGYWAGYYVHSAHPKPVSSILAKMETPKSEHVNDVDVDAFLAMEEHFNRKRGEIDGR